MTTEKQKTGKKQGKIGKGNPPIETRFKLGQSGNLQGRPKGSKNFETYFILAWKEVAEALKLGKEPDRGKIEILKIGFKEMFKGNHRFWKDFMERLFGKVKEEIEVEEKLEKIIVEIVKPNGNRENLDLVKKDGL